MANQLIICEHCDCVYEKVTLARHQKAFCVRCAGVLQRYNGLSVQQRLALTLTAAVLWTFANFYPVMSISLQGLKSSATLWDSVVALSLGPITFIALVAAISIIIAPVFTSSDQNVPCVSVSQPLRPNSCCGRSHVMPNGPLCSQCMSNQPACVIVGRNSV